MIQFKIHVRLPQLKYHTIRYLSIRTATGLFFYYSFFPSSIICSIFLCTFYILIVWQMMENASLDLKKKKNNRKKRNISYGLVIHLGISERKAICVRIFLLN